jgi:hypothetical protein
MREYHSTYISIAIACGITLLLHALLLFFIINYTIYFEYSAPFSSATTFEIAPFLPSSNGNIQSTYQQEALVPSLPEEKEEGTKEEVSETSSDYGYDEHDNQTSEDKTSGALPSAIQPSLENIPRHSPQPPRSQRSAPQRRKQWYKNKGEPTAISDNTSKTFSPSSPSTSPFNHITDIKNRIINTMPSSHTIRTQQKNSPRGISHAYDAQAQALVAINQAYNRRIIQKLAQQASFFNYQHYARENIPAHTLKVLIEWDKKGIVIRSEIVEEGINPHISSAIHNFFKTCTFPSIPPQLHDTFSCTYTIHVEPSPQGFSTFIIRVNEQANYSPTRLF